MGVTRSRRVRARLRAHPPKDARARRPHPLLFVGLVSIGCTSMLGIDGEYVEGVKSGVGGAGGRVSASGGSAGDGGGGSDTGGTSSAGSGSSSPGGGGTGALSSGGTGGASVGCGTSGPCGTGEKCCLPPRAADGGLPTPICVKPEPATGCSLETCDRCPPPPANAVAICTVDHQCDIQCIDLFTRNGDQCEPSGTGGAGGQGGAGTGGAPPCDYRKCPGIVPPPQKGCTVFSAFPCCKNDNTCGCTYAAAAYCL